jgi:HEAT repeat protein
MQPAPPVDPKKIDQWVVDLDSSMFTKRANAISQLEKLGDLAIPALKKVLAGKASLETRRRVEPLLEKLTSGSFTAEQIRVIRAIEVLDKIGTPEALQLLEHLATGAPGALTTRQAQAALARHTTASRQP